jgi:superfamily II DNA or RNA helicase
MQAAPLDLISLKKGVDPGSYRRGLSYADQKAVVQMRWDENALQGLVRGSGGSFYTAIAHFAQTDDGPLEFSYGVCSCPVGADCKHVVALVVSAYWQAGRAGRSAALGQATDAIAALVEKVNPVAPVPVRPGPAAPAAAPVPSWEQSLGVLLDRAPSPVAAGPVTPIAIELSYSPAQRKSATKWAPPIDMQPRLSARLLRPGKNGGWVAGSLSWSKLDALTYQGSYAPEQVRVLSDLIALFRSASRYSYYNYGNEKTLDLLAFESRQLWPLLDEAARTGLKLIGSGEQAELAPYGDAELVFDVISRDGALTVTPVVRLTDGPSGEPSSGALRLLEFVGTSGHGLVYAGDAGTEPNSDGEFRPAGHAIRLARLSRPVPQALQRMVMTCSRLDIPASELDRFRNGYFPRLRLAAPVISSDGSFEPPVISGPSLVLQASYGDGHDLDLRWEWCYDVGDSRVRLAPHEAEDADETGYRDPDAERSLLAGLDLPLEAFGLAHPDPAGRYLASHARLDGIDTMRFTTELLPLLDGLDDLEVEIDGEPADYREASDSLEIGVSAGALAGDADWFDLGITITVAGLDVPFQDVFVALSKGQSYLLLPGGVYFSLDKPELASLARLIEEARALQDAPPGELRISRFSAGLWEDLAELGIVSHQAAAWQEQVGGLLSIGEIGQPEQPEALHAQLRPYQREGFAWLTFLWEHKLGGILADDMGLGKTLQSLALICRAREAEPEAPPFLIVAPTSVVSNWAAEAGRFAPDLKVLAVTETQARRGEPLAGRVAGVDAVVTSYALLRIDVESYAALDWSGLFLDEAQFAKNHQSKVYQCARRVRAPFKLAITGTPMENNLLELWSLLSITAPGLFPNPAKFADFYARPIERQGSAELLAQLRRRIKPLVKRRTKEQVASDLPAKQEQVLEVELHPRHRKLYQTHLQRERQKVLHLIGDMNANRFVVLRSLTLLRQLSLHAALVDEEAWDVPSAKVVLLAEQLRDVIGGGHRALVFSQFTGFLAIVRAHLEAEGIAYCYLDGSTRDRAGVIEQFKDGSAPVFLISLKAGGFGLNLTEADYCFLLDPWWNPATEAQAVDRTHRIGQTKNVMVYRLIARDTIEEKVMALQARKAELFASVMDEGNVFGAGLTADDIRGLFD